MNDLDFITLILNNIPLFVVILASILGVSYWSVSSITYAAALDPLHFFYTFALGTKYAVFAFLLSLGYISYTLAFMVTLYWVILVLSLNFYSSRNFRFFKLIINHTPPSERFVFNFIGGLFLIFGVYLISSIGFGVFAETNRFDNNIGHGGTVRIFDSLAIIVFSLGGIKLLRYWRNSSRFFVFYGVIFIAAAFTYSLINGAKSSLLIIGYATILSIKIYDKSIKFSRQMILSLLLLSTMFALLGLYLNLRMNDVTEDASGMGLEGPMLMVYSFLHRIVANGNQTYLGLPDQVINFITTDSVITRFIIPFVGATNLSNWLGYDVTDLSVGRQILLYHSGGYLPYGGGPTSHYDIFSYVYFGLAGGAFFVLFLAYIVGTMNFMIHRARGASPVLIAFLASIWVRGLNILIEPPTGFAYIVDLLLLYFAIVIIDKLIKNLSIRDVPGR